MHNIYFQIDAKRLQKWISRKRGLAIFTFLNISETQSFFWLIVITKTDLRAGNVSRILPLTIERNLSTELVDFRRSVFCKQFVTCTRLAKMFPFVNRRRQCKTSTSCSRVANIAKSCTRRYSKSPRKHFFDRRIEFEVWSLSPMINRKIVFRSSAPINFLIFLEPREIPNFLWSLLPTFCQICCLSHQKPKKFSALTFSSSHFLTFLPWELFWIRLFWNSWRKPLIRFCIVICIPYPFEWKGHFSSVSDYSLL